MAKKIKSDQVPATTAFVDELAAQREYIKQLKASRGADLEQQRELIKQMGDKAGTLGFVDEAKFVESMRDVGYKNTAFATAELVDNAIQAGADAVEIIVHAEQGERVTAIAVMDDGHGMDKEMLLESIRWGGTHRHTNREGFGRFGMGKPSACVSQGRRFTSYSKTEDGQLHSVQVDLDEIALAALKDGGSRLPPPPVLDGSERRLPEWVRAYRKARGRTPELEVGTIVVVEKIDHVSYKMKEGLTRHLLETLGLIYRYFIGDITLVVNGTEVEPLDPLFTMPGHRDPAAKVNDLRAEDMGMLKFEVFHPDTKESQGWVRARFSRLPLTFPRIDKERGIGLDKENANFRFHVMKSYNKGLHILRRGRQVDWVESRCPWTTFVNYDWFWGCEIDFDPRLDDEFRITTSKQQVVLSERMWKLLEQAGVYDMIAKIRSVNKKERDAFKMEMKAKKAAEDRRLSELAAENARQTFGSGSITTSPEMKSAAEANTRQHAERVAKTAGVPKKVVEDQMHEDIRKRGYKIEAVDLPPGAPFFTAELLGADGCLQIRVVLNRNHRFYSDVYAADSTTPETRSAIETLLLAVGEHWALAKEQKSIFYGREVVAWSQTLESNLYELAKLSSEDADAEEDLEEPAVA